MFKPILIALTLLLIPLAVTTRSNGNDKDNLVMKQYIIYLNSGSIVMKRAAAQRLAYFKTKESVNALISVLNHQDYLVKYYAKESLIKLGEFAIPSLSQSIKSKDWDIRVSSAEILGNIGSDKGLPPLMESTEKDPHADVRAASAYALGKIGNPKVLDCLVHALKDRNWKVRAFGAKALGLLKDDRGVDPLIEALNDPNSRVRLYAVGALGRIESRRAVPHLIRALRDSDSDTREIAAWALGKINDRRAIRPLLHTLIKDRSGNVRKEAREALRRMGYSYQEIDKYYKK